MNESIQCVISRFDEDVSWTNQLPGEIRICNKGLPIDANPARAYILPAPNIGREAHTYLTHIVQDYDSLAGITLFCQGEYLSHLPKGTTPKTLIERLQDSPNKLISGGGLCQSIREWDASGQLTRAWGWGKWAEMMRKGEVRRSRWSFSAWWERFVRDKPIPGSINYYPGAIFAVRRQAILHTSRAMYKILADQSGDHNNPEEAYYLERAWLCLFGITDLAQALWIGQAARL